MRRKKVSEVMLEEIFDKLIEEAICKDKCNSCLYKDNSKQYNIVCVNCVYNKRSLKVDNYRFDRSLVK